MAGLSRVTDWGEQQSSDSSGFGSIRDPKVSRAAHLSSAVAEPPQTSDTAGDAVKLIGPYTRARRSLSRIYSISTLLKLGQMKQLDHVELRITSAALAENVFKIASAASRPRLQENLHPRRQNQSSNLTGYSATTSEEITYDASYQHPLRQPENPPLPLIQKHAGFARFLKQHASPPHHRVTAGGRIVPAGPLSPPPMMSWPSISAVITDPGKSSKTKPQGSQLETDINAPNIFKTSAGSSAPLAQQNINVNAQRISNIPQPGMMGTGDNANPHYAQMHPLVSQNGPYYGPLPVGATPISFLPDGSSFFHFNGMNYHVLSTIPSGYNPAIYSQAALPMQPYTSSSLNGLAVHHGTVDGSSPFPGHLQRPMTAQSDSHQTLHSQLAAELDDHDRFVALHLHEFSQAQNAAYSSRRRQLVEHLDSLRVHTENHGLPNLQAAPSFVKQATPLWSGANNLMGEFAMPGMDRTAASYLNTPADLAPASSQQPSFGYSSRLGPLQTPNSKCLSPDAPPFVPASVKAAVPDYFGDSQHPPSNDSQLGKSNGLAHENIKAFHPPSYQVHHNGNEETPKTPENDRQSSAPTSFHQQSKPKLQESLPLVTLEEIRYASRPGFNPPVGRPKLYCTTIREFQEVIRRVREQAKLYGCQGGASKDPAFDAEQDIRWAIHDEDPIPLPQSPADHVKNPRPWSWDDSAFNRRPCVTVNSIKMDEKADSEKVDRDVHRFIDSMNGRETRPRADGVDTWGADPDVQDLTTKTTVHGKPGFHAERQSSPSPFRRKTPVHGICNVHRANSRSFSSNSNGIICNRNSPLTGQRMGKGINSTPSKQVEKEPAHQMEDVKKGSSHGQQHQANVEDVPKTPAKSKTYSESNASAASFNERSRGTQQTWASPSQDVRRSEHGRSRFMAKPGDSRHSDSGNDNSWIYTPSKEFQGNQTANSPKGHQSAFRTPSSHRQQSNMTRYGAMDLGDRTRTHSIPNGNSDALSFDSQGIPRSVYDEPNDLPLADPPIERFLQGMLRSPRYSAPRIHQSDPYDWTPRQMHANEPMGQGQGQRNMGKENIKSEGYQDMVSWLGRGSSKTSEEYSQPLQNMCFNPVTNKARSSLAASSYHAFGQLPQYDGAGDALNHQAHASDASAPKSPRQRRHEAKAVNELSDRQTVSRAEQAKDYDVRQTSNYDYRGLTRSRFLAAVDQPQDSRAHYEQVDRYFDHLYEDETRELAVSAGRESISKGQL
ncbi:MAG: hypothetical protein Q9170_005129 [Blastenia crenularia]